MPERNGSISARQNAPEMLALLRAMSVAHRRVQRLDGAQMVLSGLIAASGIVAVTSKLTDLVATIGAAWALSYAAGLASWSGQELRRATVLQEMFDVRLFRLPWNHVTAGDEVSAHEISRLTQRFQGDEKRLRDYYELPSLPRPYDVLACQHQNLGWGARVRRRYAHAVVAVVTLWAVIGSVLGVIAQLTVSELVLRWYVPLSGMALVAVDIYQGQRDVAVERDRVLSYLEGRISAEGVRHGSGRSRSELLLLARQIQDSIFRARVTQPRVPRWFFQRFQSTDRTDFEAAMNSLAISLQGG